MSRIAVILGILVVGALGLASCGGSEPEESRVLAPTTTSPPTTTARVVPVVELFESQPISISAGNYNTCALHQDGTVSCWGASNPETLRDYNVPETILTPTKVPNISDAIAVSVGDFHICALHQDGTISCWGDNRHGELGNGEREPHIRNSNSNPTPTKVLNISDAVAVSAGSAYTCALHQDGTVSCWGVNWYGQLGNGTTENSLIPIKVSDISDATAISVELDMFDIAGYPAERSSTCALHQDGTISCWGSNRFGELGNGKSRDDYTDFKQAFEPNPTKVLNISDAIAVSVRGGHTCALHQDGTISCWGPNHQGQLGNGNEENSLTPTKVLNVSDAIAISAGIGYTCALHEDGTISCWGANRFGQLGTGNKENSLTPTKVLNISDAIAISAGGSHTCALHQDGTISCWGWNGYGQLGNGIRGSTIVTPTKVLNISDAIAISAGDRYTCALHQEGTISCWGLNEHGSLGNGGEEDSPTPTKVQNISDAIAISAGGTTSLGDNYTCALHQDGTMSCWGFNGYGQLGNGNKKRSLTPIKVQNISDAIAISAGDTHNCALHQNGTISCWGYNEYGQLGNGNKENSLTPIKVQNISDAIAISAGGFHTCALHQDSTMSCWGANSSGQLGNGKSRDDYSSYNQATESTPTKVPNISDATTISAGNYYTCTLHQDGTISCWGSGGGGILGDGIPYRAVVSDGYGGDVVDYPDAPWGSSVPVNVEGISDAIAVSTDYKHTCALHQDGTPSCWGTNWSDESVLGSKEYSLVPFQITDLSDAINISTGERHTCALHQDGTISCWGSNRYGQLGNGHTAVPTKVLGSSLGTPS